LKPRNKLEKEVVSLHEKLRPLSKTELSWIKNQFVKSVYRTKKQFTCCECSHTWPIKNMQWVQQPPTCPKCSSKLKFLKGRYRTFEQKDYFSFIQKIKNFQVVRVCFCTKNEKAGNKANYYTREVYQNWIRDDGRKTRMAVWVNGMSFYGDIWGHGDKMEIKNDHSRYSNPSYIYPRITTLPVIRRNGFTGIFYEIMPHNFFHEILRSSKSETLLKAKQIDLFYYNTYFSNGYDATAVSEFWKEIKIVIRNNYIVADAESWFDHLNLLKALKRDTLNAKNICPANFEKEHQRIIKIRREKRRQEDLIKLKAKITTDQRCYGIEKKKYFDLAFKGDNVKITFFKRIRTLMKESSKLNICAFENNYHKKKDSLLFSAKVKNQTIEIIEYSLCRKKVVQSRGLNNTRSEYHKEILKIMKKNNNQIRKVT